MFFNSGSILDRFEMRFAVFIIIFRPKQSLRVFQNICFSFSKSNVYNFPGGSICSSNKLLSHQIFFSILFHSFPYSYCDGLIYTGSRSWSAKPKSWGTTNHKSLEPKILYTFKATENKLFQAIVDNIKALWLPHNEISNNLTKNSHCKPPLNLSKIKLIHRM